ncbi:hypothetical protein S7711_03302 [Stachybotrys chartarum IBT 7711]|uniref:Uncharacterized protein n=1 Tax=Stachybotrys chartarum (strain CBS 109288 / IBT 7711) TaxID=1280523 RepID=A0A084AUL6_STACB|nr:hypothetical protein S7711_03302 [Stachybotrys chartarum IBT 7711]KFA52805.1 hypothetical protein S40293_00846 [Stachybotrys chartarum IBT 40293]
MSTRSPPGFSSRPTFLPQCTHLTMTRVYDNQALCVTCNRPGPIGWLYQCTQDTEETLERAAARGEQIHIDELGYHFVSKLDIRARSPAARQDKLSFFNEISQDQMASYRPDQIAQIIQQRENVHTKIKQEKDQAQSVALIARIGHLTGLHHRFQTSSFGHTVSKECQYQVCPNCRPSAADRAYLSLDAIVKGEVPPTAAVGYGFHVMGERPVMNAEIIKHIGYLPVPLRPRSAYGSSSLDSELSVMELLDYQIAQGQGSQQRHQQDEHGHDGNTTPLSTRNAPLGNLKHSPRCENLATYSDHGLCVPRGPLERPLSELELESFCHLNGSHPTKIPSTPPGQEQIRHLRSSSEYTTQVHDHDAVAQTPRSAPAYIYAPQYPYTLPAHDTVEPNDVEDDRESLSSTNSNLGHIPACSDDSFTLQHDAEDAHRFAPAPLKVISGVAVLEESVELGVPDVITQA